MEVKRAKWLIMMLTLAMILAMLPAVYALGETSNCGGELLDVELNDGIGYVGSDTETKGDWITAAGSPIDRYGSCAYILPNPPRNTVEEVVGDFSAPVGFSIGDSSTWSKLGQSPWNWTASQIQGLGNYRPDPPYHDEFWTAAGMEEFTYSLSGTYMPVVSETPRSLVAEEPGGSLSTRAACWFAGSGTSPPEMGIDLNLPAGKYMLSLYLIDWDTTLRAENVTVAVSAEDNELAAVSSFSGGVYVNFFVYLPAAGTVNVDVVKTAGGNAVVSGVFLSSTSETPIDVNTAEVRSLPTDSTTKGMWIGTYGDQGWILSAYNALATKTVYAWNPAYDRSWNINYSVVASQYAWGDKTAFVDAVQYPVFEWAWASGTPTRPTDLRAAYYPIVNQWRAAVWDDGGERCKPTNGYMDFNLHFPEGRFMLSLYSYDYERTTRASQEYQLFDADNISAVLASSVVSGDAFNEGVYESFVVEAPVGGRDIVVRVYNDAGHPTPNVNVLLQGIFVDCLETPCYDICGSKYFAGTEDGIDGFTITLEEEVDGEWAVVATAVTAGGGKYCFEGLEAGKYRVSESLVGWDGWTQVYPDPLGIDAGYHYVELPAGATNPEDPATFYDFRNVTEIETGDDTVWAWGDEAIANNTLGKSNAWGWVNYICAGVPTTELTLYAGAGQNDLDKGTAVGTVAVEYDGTDVRVTYEITAARYTLTEAHLWVGATPLPMVGKRYTSAPGQFPYSPIISADGKTAEFALSGVVPDEYGCIYVAAHGVVSWYSWSTSYIEY